MKLKKIASLALAGVMAISMLAGCSGKTENNENGSVVVTPGSSSIATAFNNGQDADNKVKVTFSASSALETKVAKAVKQVGEDAEWNDIQTALKKLTGKESENLATKATPNSDLANGMTKTAWYGEDYESKDYWTEADAVNAAARDMDEEVAELAQNTKEGKQDGDKYYEFSYTGEVAMVVTEQVAGTTVYHVVYTITQTANEKTVKAE